MTALQEIVKKAKALKKAYPKKFSKWTEYVKLASTMYKKDSKKIAGPKDSKILKSELAKKGLKLPHGYKTIKRKRKIAGVPKKTAKKVYSTHKDTKSHNVKISVMSGIDEYPIRFTRLTNDVNGNPRYAVHFLEFLNTEESTFIPFSKKYEYALKKAKLIGGKKFDNKQYGGGVVFQSYNIQDLEKKIFNLKNSTPKIKF